MQIVIGLFVTAFFIFLARCLSWLRAHDHHKRGILLDLLLANPDSYALELQSLSGGKLGLIIHRLRLLEDEGLVSTRYEVRSASVPGPRPSIRYSLTPTGLAEAKRLRETHKLAA
jgi:DNA-binding PadR family transcriptional regulator